MIAYVSVEMSTKEWSKNTFGWARAEVRLHKVKPLCALPFFAVEILLCNCKLWEFQTQMNPTVATILEWG